MREERGNRSKARCPLGSLKQLFVFITIFGKIVFFKSHYNNFISKPTLWPSSQSWKWVKTSDNSVENRL